MKTGDILLVGSNSWLSRQIQRFTKSIYSHVGFIIIIEGNLMVLEEDRTGKGINCSLILSPISKYYDKKYNVKYRSRKFFIDEKQFLTQSLNDLGRFRYSYFDLIISQPIYQITGWWIGDKNIKDKRAVCSQYVAYRLKHLYPKWYEKAPSDFEFDNNFSDE